MLPAAIRISPFSTATLVWSTLLFGSLAALTIYTQIQTLASLTRTMKALLLSEYKKLSVVDMPTPEIGDDDVLVRVRACGICGSDIHGYDGSTGRRIPPLVMGHEAAGVIERVGRARRRASRPAIA